MDPKAQMQGVPPGTSMRENDHSDEKYLGNCNRGWFHHTTEIVQVFQVFHLGRSMNSKGYNTAVLSEAWAKLRDWASVAGRGWLLLSGSLAHASLKTAVCISSTF